MKKALSLLLCLALLFSLAPVEIHAEEEEPVTLDLAQGSIVISATGYAQDGGAETPYTGDYTIVQTDTTYVDKTIAVTGGAHKITMGSKVVIDVHTISDAYAFSIAKGASVELVLTKSVTLKSGKSRAGLAVPTGAAVTISADSRYGALNAVGGDSARASAVLIMVVLLPAATLPSSAALWRPPADPAPQASAAVASAPARMSRSTSPAARSQPPVGPMLPASAAAAFSTAPVKTVRSSSTGRRL